MGMTVDQKEATSGESGGVKTHLTVSGRIYGDFSHDGDWVEIASDLVDIWNGSPLNLATALLENVFPPVAPLSVFHDVAGWAQKQGHPAKRIGPRVRITIEVLED